MSTDFAHLDRMQAIAEYDLFNDDLTAELQELCKRTAERLDGPDTLTAVQVVLDTATATLATNAGAGDFLSALGGSPNEMSFCPAVVETGRPYVEGDLPHSVHAGNPGVRAGLVRAYAGVPVVLPNGVVMGSHCVMVPETHEFTAADITALERAAEDVVEVISRYER